MSMRNDMQNDTRENEMRDDMHHHRGVGSWIVPLVLLVALALGGLIYAFTSGDGNMVTNQSAPSASTTGSGAGTGMTGDQTGAATTQTPRGAATGGGGAASR